jgi:hypothetical protein
MRESAGEKHGTCRLILFSILLLHRASYVDSAAHRSLPKYQLFPSLSAIVCVPEKKVSHEYFSDKLYDIKKLLAYFPV